MRLPFLANLLGNGTAGEADTVFLLEDTRIKVLREAGEVVVRKHGVGHPGGRKQPLGQ
jgi:hypothetical protein